MDEVGWLEELEQLDAVAWEPPWSKDDDWTVVCEGSQEYPCDGGCTACDGEGTVKVVNIESVEDDQNVGYVTTTGLQEFASASGSLIVAMRNNLRRLLAMARAGEKLRKQLQWEADGFWAGPRSREEAREAIAAWNAAVDGKKATSP